MSTLYPNTSPALGASTQHQGPALPAPWTLRGNGVIVVIKPRHGDLRHDQAIPDDIRSTLKSPLSVLMFVNYTESNAGPYQELLFIPGTCDFSGKRLATISNIYVSTQSSVDHGRSNWGIPKQRCEFTQTQPEQGHVRTIASIDGVPFFDLQTSSLGPRLPINTAWVPSFLKTLGQRMNGRQFVYSPQARGRSRLARIHKLQSMDNHFPHLSSADVVTALEITDFEMVFPVPDIRDVVI
ncbi:acetoacetate decarboxylase family protein [Limnobacter humi]|uniref:Acetoacetate decarboxylase family protein n=1 Tax=Limnobacter humi TaxID=1778671 RepID=A0ABT1WF94_9BURK|nr:acetoacetate decarboxylase family protein [Limnobacter humi]MCQ8896176.1 acetoacetate decarboxylase family protein [Limnobacter humi]